MDDKKQIKEFINYICDWVDSEYKSKGHTGFIHNFNNDRMSYLIADKGIEQRIEKHLLKIFGLKSKVRYELSPSPNLYLDGELRIKLLIK